ncbi:hypothetical protein CO058_03140 [candidate division WWE3 bacterium CG_4_9_14_0_2_um_filter_35_11]|uniref:Nucleotidyl transferase domain-containing protein n=1 Tax=candidate division WWE3 bacterium CG_4_9_14_0_2_um_filter_35_11 TaxID=1975077 RepID=A0A2M8EL64_UNCKA|nr:MAG: hypothetical protein COV25_03630 [candidate division WWE3 bacterium CG10_big_fil_rev_8_21_14_0_10_35_32]PJC23482.1 MAG: hypothetical protein CO058_03140 [candidate division WWE3 bacterium CG_4_9_14_0_2_um_filter_35_11]
MQKALLDLKNQICKIHKENSITDEEFSIFAENTTVALMAGGESSRFRSVPSSENTNKNSYKLPNDDTMIEMTIRMYRDAGIKNFVALVYHKSETIMDLLGDGSSMGVKITYSHDPEHPVGKGGAVLNALVNGSIPENHNLIVHNPDDVILDYEGSFPRDIIAGHIEGTKSGSVATVVVVEETPYAYTGMQIIDNKVTNIEMYPMIPIPTHIGVTLFSPDAFLYFRELFDLTKKSDFEMVLFPKLSSENKLYAVSIPENNWLAVNTLKAYNDLVKRLEIKREQ